MLRSIESAAADSAAAVSALRGEGTVTVGSVVRAAQRQNPALGPGLAISLNPEPKVA